MTVFEIHKNVALHFWIHWPLRLAFIMNCAWIRCYKRILFGRFSNTVVVGSSVSYQHWCDVNKWTEIDEELSWDFTPIKGHNINVKSKMDKATTIISVKHQFQVPRRQSFSSSSLLQLHSIAFSPFVVWDFYNLSSQVQKNQNVTFKKKISKSLLSFLLMNFLL